MNSSTSSFRGETGVLVFAVVALLGCEVIVQMAGPRLSTDVQHIRAIPVLAADLAEGSRPRILVMGNSVINHAVDGPDLEKWLRPSAGQGCRVVKVTPDASHIYEWYYLFRRFFLRPARPPDVLVLGFARDYLEDSCRANPTRLGAYYASAADYPGILWHDLTDFRDRMDFLMGGASMTYTLCDNVRWRILKCFAPDYEENRRRVNRVLAAHSPPAEPAPATYVVFRRFLEKAGASNVRVIAVAMPTMDSYRLDPAIEKTVAEMGMTFFDLRHPEGLEKRHFDDPLHLNEEGTALFTRRLAEAMQGIAGGTEEARAPTSQTPSDVP